MDILSMHLHEKTRFFVEVQVFEKRLRQCIQTMLKQLRETFFNFGERKLNMSRLDLFLAGCLKSFPSLSPNLLNGTAAVY